MASLNSPFKCNLREFIVDEIALEGLEGIGINLLWRRLEARISAPVTDKMKNRLWSFIVNSENIFIYELPEPVPDLEVIDRLTLVDPETGYMLDPDVYLDGPYEYQPIEDAYGCSLHYNTRVLLDEQIAELPYEKVIAKYGLKMVLVASLNERWRALAPQLPFFYLQHLGPLHFCMLELIGRSRENGQMTTGKTNLTKIVKDPKILFYHRKTLQKLDLVRITYITQVTAERTIKSLLIRLKRFHKTDVLTVPKSGKIHDLVNYLKAQPDFCEKTDVVMKKGLMTSAQNKKFQKKVSIFHFEEEPIPCDKLTPKERKRNIEAATSIETPKVKSEPDKKSTPKETPKKPMRKRYMYLVSKSDESSQSEDEEVQQPLKCQYKVGVNILRQAYERFLEAGRAGLTQNELAELIGVEFYVSRTICRIFKTKNIVREFMECRGRQRISRYIAIVATSKMDSKVAEEKEKLRKLLDKGHSLCKKEQGSKPNAGSDSETPVVKKKIKLENSTIKPSEINISEVELIDGVKNGNKQLSLKANLTLRQLKFSSGILKVIHDKTFVLGYQTLSNLVAKDYNEPPMDTKAMKLLLQGMVSGGNLKIYKLKMPRVQHQYSVIICAPHIKPNHPLLREKYKDLVHKITTTQSLQKKIKSGIRPLSQYAYPRYVKVQKLHEALIKIIYFNDVKKESTESPDGFISIKDFLPELPVDVALGHLTSGSLIDVSSLKLDDNLLNSKICNAPTDLYRSLLNSKNLHSSLRSTLKVLASFGLVQLIVLSSAEALEFPDNSMTINWFYVSKHAKIIDTTGLWPRANVDIANLEREFHFDSLEAVQDYWNSVYIISTNTTIDIPNRKKTIQVRPPVRTKVQALELGKFGPRYGNGIGPCGFDSSFFIDMPRLWKSYCSRSLKFKQVSKPPVNIPKFERPKRLARVQKKKKPPIKKIVKKPEVVAEIVKQANYRQRQHTKKKAKEIVWTLQEDRILMMCKAAITIMSPISQPGCLQVRNLVAKDILSMKDPRKTQSICHRRSLVVELNSTLTHERNCILNELRRHRLVSKYEGILKKIRILYCTNMPRYINEARLPMLELVWIIHEVSKNITEQQELPSVALSFEDFHKNYFIVQSSANTLCNLYKTPCKSEADVVIGTLKEAIVMTVMHTFNHVMQKSGAKLIYTYFRRFPETVLRVAIEPLRKCGAIAAKEKLINAHMHYVNLDDIAQCSYKISANYQRKWISRLNAEFVDSLTDCFYGNFTKTAIKAAPDSNCFCFELQAKDLIEIVAITAPVIAGPSGSIIQEEQLNVIDIATNYKLKSGTLGWENKTTQKFADCYKEIKIGDALDYLARRSFIRNEDVRETKMKHPIVSYLKKKRQNGATFKDLQSYLNYERKKLIADLSELQSNNIIRRVGFYGNVVVLMEFVKDWTMDVSGGHLIPLPWLTLKSEMRNEIFFKWAGVVMNKVFECPRCSIAYLSDMAEFLTSRAVQDICELLQKCDCVTLRTFTVKELSLYTDDDDTPAELDDYNEFESPENIVVLPAVDCLVKYAFLRNIVLNS